jgi:DNA-binding FrmR family transcriptional regulator
MKAGREPTIQRLRRIEGQVRGLIGMIEQDRYCLDILHQLSAVRAALGKVEDQVLKIHAATCVEEAIRGGTPDEQRDKFEELVELFARVKR